MLDQVRNQNVGFLMTRLKLSCPKESGAPVFRVRVQGSLNAIAFLMHPGPEVIKLFSCSTQLRSKFILLINVEMPTIVGILTFISRINNWLW